MRRPWGFAFEPRTEAIVRPRRFVRAKLRAFGQRSSDVQQGRLEVRDAGEPWGNAQRARRESKERKRDTGPLSVGEVRLIHFTPS